MHKIYINTVFCFYSIKLISLVMIFNIFDNTTELWMTTYKIGEMCNF